MSNDVNMLRAKLRKALGNIGRNNGHAMPPSTHNADPLLHEYFIASEAVSYFKQRADAAKTELLTYVGDTLDDAVTSVIELGAGTSIVGAEGDLYSLTIDISKAAMRLNQTALRNYLVTEVGMSKSDVDKAFAACSTASSPAKKLKVASR